MSSKTRNQHHKISVLAVWRLGRGIVISVTLLTLFLFLTSLAYASPLKGPWRKNEYQRVFHKKTTRGLNPLRSLVGVYRTYLSPIDGKNCPMYPACSEYSLQCFKEHGLFIGWVMTCDRLFRCGRDELRLSPEIIVNDELRCFDPLENNDFWWCDGQ